MSMRSNAARVCLCVCVCQFVCLYVRVCMYVVRVGGWVGARLLAPTKQNNSFVHITQTNHLSLLLYS
jgi:hypothetical protein